MWDATGSTAADRIRMDQRTGDFTAEGHVSFHAALPDAAEQAGRRMLSGDEPLQAPAAKMDAHAGTGSSATKARVVLWQGANRIAGGRGARSTATSAAWRRTGNVRDAVLWRRRRRTAPTHARSPSRRPRSPRSSPWFARRRWSTRTRTAWRTTPAACVMTRPGLAVKAAEMRGVSGESRGGVRGWRSAYRRRKGGDRAAAPGRREAGRASTPSTTRARRRSSCAAATPQFADSLRGRTRGNELTYYANDDRLLVNRGSEPSGQEPHPPQIIPP